MKSTLTYAMLILSAAAVLQASPPASDAADSPAPRSTTKSKTNTSTTSKAPTEAKEKHTIAQSSSSKSHKPDSKPATTEKKKPNTVATSKADSTGKKKSTVAASKPDSSGKKKTSTVSAKKTDSTDKTKTRTTAAKSDSSKKTGAAKVADARKKESPSTSKARDNKPEPTKKKSDDDSPELASGKTSNQPATSKSRETAVSLMARLKPKSTIFNTDYKTRSASAVLPSELHGEGLGGESLPIGNEDAFRKLLPATYMPTDLKLIPAGYCYYEQPTYLRGEAATSLIQMFDDAARRGLNLRVFSGYRDYSHQLRLYREAVRRNPRQQSVAKPGSSEHMLGTTADITCDKRHLMTRDFMQTPEGKWLSSNGYRYGWEMTVRESGTGAVVEPWHLRYLGANAKRPAGTSMIANASDMVSKPAGVAARAGKSILSFPARLFKKKDAPSSTQQ